MFENQKAVELGRPCIVMVAAHSGGHIIPCLTMAEQAKKETPNTKIIMVTSTSQLDTTIVGQSKTLDHVVTLPLTTIPYRKPWLLPRALFYYARAVITSFSVLRTHKPTKVITTGGSIALPVCFAAWLLRIPIELLELNIEPGKTIKALAPLATKIGIVFAGTQHYFKNRTCVVTPYPVRFSNEAKTTFNREAELRNLNFSPTRTTIFVIGGSQGSQFLNDCIKDWVSTTSPKQIQIIHQTGRGKELVWTAFYKEHGIPAITFAYHHNLAPFYQLADLTITRAGAGTLAELQFFNCTTLVIPLITASTSHQLQNAQAYAKMSSELFTVCEQKNFEQNPTCAWDTIDRLLAPKWYMHPDQPDQLKARL